jgi:hypothetical protein
MMMSCMCMRWNDLQEQGGPTHNPGFQLGGAAAAGAGETAAATTTSHLGH